MAARGAAQILRERTSDEAAHDPRITTTMDESSRSMAEHIIQSVADRFDRRLTEEISRVDRRLTEEISAVRVEMHKGFGDVRVEIANMGSGLRTEIETGKVSAIRWTFLLWLGQIGTIGGLLAYLQ